MNIYDEELIQEGLNATDQNRLLLPTFEKINKKSLRKSTSEIQGRQFATLAIAGVTLGFANLYVNFE